MIDELFADTVVICHHEELPNNLRVDGEINVGRDSIPDK